MTSLKPCPFCGGEATAERIGKSGYYYVACNTAYCCDFGKFDTEAEAIAAWNTRAELGSGTCENVWAESGKFKCSECALEVNAISTNTTAPRPIAFCPNCGRAVKRG